jgi:mono/diheme cytochrome c family protein
MFKRPLSFDALRITPWLVLILSLTALTSGCAWLRGYAEGHSEALQALSGAELAPLERAKAGFVHDDTGHLNTDTLATHALPWKLVFTALVLRQADQRAVPPSVELGRTRLREHGFLYPSRLANWPAFPGLGADHVPLGMTVGDIRRRVPPIQLQATNISCAGCHAGPLFDAQGQVSDQIWLGLPNRSLNLDAYVEDLYHSLVLAMQKPDRLLATIPTLFPDVSERELKTLQRFALPQVRARLVDLQAMGKPLPFDNGGPGLTNGIAALKLQLGLIDALQPAAEHGYTAIPELGGRTLRSSMLYDGAYAYPDQPRFADRRPEALSSDQQRAIAALVSFFTVPTQGGSARSARAAIPATQRIVPFMASYRSPPFPGKVELARAETGQVIYAEHCADCHGHYQGGPRAQLQNLPNQLSPQAEMGTDPQRWQSMDARLVAAISRARIDDMLIAEQTGGYVAPPLDGLWARAPYLHNGSVPTLWHLMRPASRPQRFMTGGHALDYQRMGIALVSSDEDEDLLAYPHDHQPYSQPSLYDTRLPGRNNRGHEQPFAQLSEDQRDALLEYLKLL